MLSISAVSSGSSSYYARDNYYAAEGLGSVIPNSNWFGKGSRKLALAGRVSVDGFSKIMSGNLPNGQVLGRMKGGELLHAHGWDLTFSAPKSVSLLIEVLGDKRVTAAHDKAVEAALSYVEKHILQTRIYNSKTNGQKKVLGQKMVAACFRHEVSRSLDPQTHTHAVIANVAIHQTGKARSVDSHPFYANAKLIGALYRAELASILRSLGYETRKTGNSGLFEIEGIPKSLLEAFSTRSQEIAAALEGRENTSARMREKAALITRSKKKTVNRSDLITHWQARAKSINCNIVEIFDQAKKSPLSMSIPKPVKQIVEEAIAHVSENQAVFSPKVLRQAALEFGIGHQKPSRIFSAIAKSISSGRIILGTDEGSGLLTTPEALELEVSNITAMRQGLGETDPVLPKRIVMDRLDHTHLSNEQKQAVERIIRSTARTIGIQGTAGSGKTTLLTEAVKLLKDSNIASIGLAPSSAAADELSKAGLPTMTLQRFLLEYQNKKADLSNSVIILDEASMVSSQQMADLFKIINQGNARRLTLVGDIRQLDAVASGAPFTSLQKAGLPTVHLKNIRRQKSAHHKQAVLALADGDLKTALTRLAPDIQEAQRSKLPDQAANLWLKLPVSERKNSALLAPSHKLCEAITDNVRQALFQEGLLGPNAQTFQTLSSKHLSAPQRSAPESYGRGDILLFRSGDKSNGIMPGTYFEVTDVTTSGSLRLTSQEQAIEWVPNRSAGTEVFTKEMLSVATGDRLRWTRNDPERRFVNSEFATVLGLSQSEIVLEAETGERHRLALKDPALKHVTHGWVNTFHAMQGRTVDNAIIAMEARHTHLTTQKAFYVAVSRSRKGLTLITDDRQALGKTLELNTGKQITASEIVQKKIDSKSKIETNETQHSSKELELERHRGGRSR